MLTDSCQRWRERRDSYRPAGELFEPRAFEVSPIESDRTARAFVEAHHYSGSYPAARRRFGLFERGELVGVAVFSVPMRAEALRPWTMADGLELGRFVLLDGVRANGETWFLARCLDALKREGFAGVVSLSDPTARTSASGAVVFGGHVGTIYQASNAVYTGRASPQTLRLLPDGSVFSNRAASKIRKSERGWRYAVDQLVAHGASEPRGDLHAWLREVVPTITRPLRHHGNHRYLFALSRAAKRAIPASLAYPKIGRPSC
jgi:hypothetical protein